MATNTTDDRFATSWVAEPGERGTWSIIYSCIFTIGLCVWSALHLNIPCHADTKRVLWPRRAKWVLLGIIAPELVLYSAFQQYFAAKQVCKEMLKNLEAEKNLKDDQKTGADHSVHSDTACEKSDDIFKANTQYGFYIVMGGFTIDISHLYHDEKVTRVTLTPGAVSYLARMYGCEPFLVKPKDIADKSKADGLAKVLVVLQVLWIFLSCISRWAQRRTVSILEYHTLAHAVCAVFMWIFWFHKPLDIKVPTCICPSGYKGSLPRAQNFGEDLALALMQSHVPSLHGWAPKISDHPTPWKLGFWRWINSTQILGKIMLPEIQPEAHSLAVIPPDLATRQIFSDESDEASVQALELDPEFSAKLSKLNEPSNVQLGNDKVKMVPVKTGEILPCGLGPILYNYYGRSGQGQRTRRSHESIEFQGIPWARVLRPVDQYGEALSIDPSCTSVMQVILHEEDIRRWSLAANAFRRLEKHLRETIHKTHETPQDSLGTSQASYTQILLDAHPIWPMEYQDLYAEVYEPFCLRASNFDSTLIALTALRRLIISLGALGVLGLMSGLYTGMHLALWNYEFPTPHEATLWKVAGCTLGSAVPITACFVLPLALWLYVKSRQIQKEHNPRDAEEPEYGVATDSRDMESIALENNNNINDGARRTSRSSRTTPQHAEPSSEQLDFKRRRTAGVRLGVITDKIRELWQWYCKNPVHFWFVFGLPILFGVLWVLLYGVSRIFLVTESFISLRHMRRDVFHKVSWAQYIPHF